MRILKQIIEKKIELHNEFILNRQYLRGIWQFYCCFNLALALLSSSGFKYDERLLKKRNVLWKRWLSKEGLFDEKKFKKIQKYMQEDMRIIIMALNKIESLTAENPYEQGNIDKPYAIGILSYEMPE